MAVNILIISLQSRKSSVSSEQEDPLERLKALELRLQGFSADRKKEAPAPLSPPKARRSKTPKDKDDARKTRDPSPEPFTRLPVKSIQVIS